MVVWPPKESVKESLPEIFLRPGYGKCRVTIDCAKVLIERPKSLSTQAAIWSDYKHHNTFKCLVGITPTGFILFLSSCYGARASNKFSTKDSGFYDLLERDDEIMADRGLQIREDLLLYFCRLVVSPDARVKNTMTKPDVKKTKEVAINVEGAINSIIFLRILKGTIPVTMIQHVDGIILPLQVLSVTRLSLCFIYSPEVH